MTRILSGITLVAAVALLAGCGSSATGRPCADLALRRGVALQIRAPFAGRVHSAELELCARHRCRRQHVTLAAGSRSVDQGCRGGVCSARSTPTGDLTGFVDVDDLPRSGVVATLTLRSSTGEVVLRGSRRLDAAGSPTTGCGRGNGIQLHLGVSGNGTLTG